MAALGASGVETTPETRDRDGLVRLLGRLFECVACAKRYRDPRTLLCGHNFCLSCVEGFARDSKQGSLICPTCDKVTEVTQGSGINDLPRPEIMTELQQKLSSLLDSAARQETVRYCDPCGAQKVVATTYCYQCRRNLCLHCLAKHQQHGTASHKTVPITDSMFCITHPGEVVCTFCQDCDSSICADCIFTGHSAHRTSSIEELGKQSRQRLQEFLKTLKSDKISEVKGRQKVQEARSLETELRDVMLRMKSLLKELENQLEQVERDANAKLSAEIKTLALYESDGEVLMSSRRGLIDLAMYLTQQASDPELLKLEKDFPVSTLDDQQGALVVELPVMDKTFETLCAKLQQMVADCKVEFRKELVGTRPIGDLHKELTIPIDYVIGGITMDVRGQRLVARTDDVSGPLKVYNYSGQLQESLGSEVTGLADCSHIRGICMDTQRDCYMAPCEKSLVLVDRAGQQIKSITVGSNNMGVAYHTQGDCYLVSDYDKHTVYLIDPDTSQVTRQIGCEGSGPTQFSGPYNIHVGSVSGVGDSVIIVSDHHNHCIKVFDLMGQHMKTYSSKGSLQRQLSNRSSVCTDHQGRIIVCDMDNTRVVSFWTDGTGRDHWDCVLAKDWGGNYPWLIALDTQHSVMAVVDTSCETIYLYH